MLDETEELREAMFKTLNRQVESVDVAAERARLETRYGRVWDTRELTRDFAVRAFAAPLVMVEERSSGQKGTLFFQHNPRFYFGWQREDKTV